MGIIGRQFNVLETGVPLVTGQSQTFHFHIPPANWFDWYTDYNRLALNGLVAAPVYFPSGKTVTGASPWFMTGPDGVILYDHTQATFFFSDMIERTERFALGGVFAITVINNQHVNDRDTTLPFEGPPTTIVYNPFMWLSLSFVDTVPMPVLGCRDITATNFNPLATQEDGSCLYVAGGGGGSGTGGAGGVGGSSVPKCMNVLAINYNPLATVDDGSCILPIRGCTIAGSLNYNPAANVNDGSCIPIIPGCTVPGAINYNPLANKDDGSGVFPFAYPNGPPPPDLCVWSGDLSPACVWTWSDTFAAPPQAPAQILSSTYYGIGNVALLLGNEPL